MAQLPVTKKEHSPIKINHNTTLEQYEDIIKEAKQQCMVRTINKRF